MRRQLPVPHLFSRIARRANFTLLVLCAAAACGASIRSAHAQSALDGFDPNANGSVSAIAVQPDGKILIGGSFTTLAPNGGPPVARNRIARLNPDGTLDAAFNPNADNDVYVIALQPDGKVLIGGAFTSVAGQSRTHLARLDAATGQPDLFNPSPNSTVYALALQADGSILVGGGFTSIGGQTRSSLARLDRTTGLADSFSVNANGLVRRIIVQSDGKILVCGGFLAIGGETRKHIARLDPTSGRADSFNPNANSFVMTIALQADGKVLAGGAFSGANSIGGQSRKYIARLDATTGLADSFDPHASIEINRIVVQPDGKILVGSPVGFSNTIGGQVREGIARLDPATGLVDSFNPGTNESVVEIAMQQDGKILIGGRFNGVNSVDGQTRNRIARLGADGRVDNTLENPSIHRGSDITKVVRAIALQPDGKILIGGLFTSVLGVERNHIARLNADGTLDVAFNPNVTTPGYSASSGDGVASIVVQPDGKILVGGYFVRVGGQERRHLARLDPITGSADSFNPDPDSAIHSIALTADGKLLVGGQFASIGGQVRSNLARLSTHDWFGGFVQSEAKFHRNCDRRRREGKLLIAGGFTIVDAQFRNRIARLDPLTGAADAFNPNANGPVDVLAIQADGKVLAAGGFNYMSGQPRSQIARIDPVSGLADAFNPGTNGWVYSIAVQPDGKILLGGQFSTIGGQDRAYIARLDPATGVPDSFNASVDEFVEAIALQPDGKMLVGGTFANVGGLPRNLLARLSNDTAALQNLNVTPGAVSWTRDGSGPLLERVMFEGSSNG
jgi:uncharacterized delta-60 repeat protein